MKKPAAKKTPAKTGAKRAPARLPAAWVKRLKAGECVEVEQGGVVIELRAKRPVLAPAARRKLRAEFNKAADRILDLGKGKPSRWYPFGDGRLDDLDG